MKMKKCLHYKIQLFVIFCIALEFIGCISSKTVVSSSEIPLSGKYYYIVKGQNAKYLIEQVSIDDRIFSGKITEESGHLGYKKVKIYVTSDSLINLYSDKTLSIKLDDISKVETIKTSTGKAVLVYVGSVIGFIILFGALTFEIDPF